MLLKTAPFHFPGIRPAFFPFSHANFLYKNHPLFKPRPDMKGKSMALLGDRIQHRPHREPLGFEIWNKKQV
jgi:hypothetical protein